MKRIFLTMVFCLSGLFIFYSPIFAQRKAVSGTEVTGTFRNKAGSEFLIQALGQGKLKLEFSGIYSYKMANGEGMANTGEASGEAIIEADTATFVPDYSKEAKMTCTITLRFTKAGTLIVTQEESEGGCGFGNNVRADGTYHKISGKKPKFEQN